ncbi:GNAT family N-acetyltransferase [Pseudodesulfovibrio sp. zrk46]|uniref:GNAT family N-acetyltransferase n=1 Tax=Pseudodesulfovibrio sp. zrk46 TaxID=2725288 RepID=UPI00144911F4|nr:GNAT family N-acetyltransferase [Pseudodesulfovibrio sp. zrk46]QJB56316.1 GNAT family N-acetyltransferase [Pseudodesulfovibrio sp. zrk46]
MTNAPVIRTMTRDDVDFAIRLAAKEGWNPGLSDAECFYAADPEGFFIAEQNGEPVATISAVRYGDGYGFVGLYIVIPAERGKGYGMALWDHAMTHLEGRNVGLDAVTEQEQTYKKSGFSTSYRSTRFQGIGGGSKPEEVVPLSKVDFTQIASYDRQCFPEGRESFLRSWLEAVGVRGFAVMDGDNLSGFGVIRPCASGYKIGPLFADNGDVAETIYQALMAAVPGEKVFLDVIEPNGAAVKLAKSHDLEEVFVTVRMYTEDEPATALDKIFGVTSFELG